MNNPNTITTLKFCLKIIHWISILFLCLWILIPVLGFFIPLELTNSSSKETYMMIRVISFPIAATLTVLTGMLKCHHNLKFIIVKIIIAVGVAYLSSIISAIALFGSMCAWSTDKVFFESKQNPSITIVQRSLDCGAFDSSHPVGIVFKIRRITPNFIWAPKIDTAQIDKNEWIRIEE